MSVSTFQTLRAAALAIFANDSTHTVEHAIAWKSARPIDQFRALADLGDFQLAKVLFTRAQMADFCDRLGMPRV